METPTNTPLDERVASSIKQLASAAQELNSASGEMGQAIAAIDSVLQSLNIGVPTWTRITGGTDQPHGEDYWYRDLGYAKISNRWGIALRDVSGSCNDPEDERCDSWLFNDAPRWLRIEGAEKIPDLLDALIKSTQETTVKIKATTARVNEFATVIAQAAKGEKAKTASAHVFLSSSIASPRLPPVIASPDSVPGAMRIAPPFDIQSPIFSSPSIVNPKSPVPPGGVKKSKGGK